MHLQTRVVEYIISSEELQTQGRGVYKYIENFPKSEHFGLKIQIRRAVVSIESCIAEGFSRYHYKDRLNFYYDARGSIAEVESQTITAKDLDYIDQKRFEEIISQAEKTAVILGGLVRSTEKLSSRRNS